MPLVNVKLIEGVFDHEQMRRIVRDLTADVGDFAELNERFADEPPARMVMQVPLPRGLRISIGCVAVVEG
jgi:hypothetical protein